LRNENSSRLVGFIPLFGDLVFVLQILQKAILEILIRFSISNAESGFMKMNGIRNKVLLLNVIKYTLIIEENYSNSTGVSLFENILKSITLVPACGMPGFAGMIAL